MNAQLKLTNRPEIVRHGVYVAVISSEEHTPFGVLTTWDISRNDVLVGKMFQGGGGHGEHPTASLTRLVWSGVMPPGASDPKSPEYGIAFDIGPHDTREQTLEVFARSADRLIAWRELNSSRERALNELDAVEQQQNPVSVTLKSLGFVATNMGGNCMAYLRGSHAAHVLVTSCEHEGLPETVDERILVGFYDHGCSEPFLSFRFQGLDAFVAALTP